MIALWRKNLHFISKFRQIFSAARSEQLIILKPFFRKKKTDQIFSFTANNPKYDLLVKLIIACTNEV